MYRGFQLRLNSPRSTSHLSRSLPTNKFIEKLEGYAGYGGEMLKADRAQVEEILDGFLLSDDSLDGSKIQANWFPEIKADVFISHSHQDKNLALGLAWFLKEHFELKAFIDSAVWGYADNLLKGIDAKYCLSSDRNLYDYKKRNWSTSHVHMMLSMALAGMIDNTECLFFLDTPHSKRLHANAEEKTSSPWIYAEIAMSRLIRQRTMQEHRSSPVNECFSADTIQHTLVMNHLTKLTRNDLQKWMNEYNKDSDCFCSPLDCLYQLNPLKKDE